MPIEIPCPSCGAVLRAPESATGRKARCRKCQHSFRLPGEKVDDTVGEESTPLSAIDTPAFAFDAPAGEMPPAEVRASKSKYSKSLRASMAGSRGQPAKSRSGLMLLILGGLVLAGAGAFGIYSAMSPAKPVETASATEPVKEKPPEPVKEKKKEPEKASDRKATTPEAKPVTAKGPEKRKPAATVVGGLKLPEPPAKAETLAKFDVRVSAEAKYDDVRKFFVTGGETPMAAVVWLSNRGFKDQGMKETVDRYNLVTGVRVDRTEIDAPAWPRACDLSPNGDLFINEGPANTLVLYDLNAKAKVGSPIKPFAGDEKAPAATIVAAFFLDQKSVLVAAKDGRLETWNARTGERTGSGGLGSVTLSAKSLALNPDRTKLIALAGGSLFDVPVKSLVGTAVMPIPHGGDGLAVAIDSSDRVAALYRATEPGPHTRLLVMRLGDATGTVNPALDDSVGTPEAIDWCGAEAFTFSTGSKGVAVVFETEINRPLATLWPQGGKAKHVLASGKHYSLMPDAADEKKCLLVRIDFPPNDFLPLRNEVEQTKAPIGFLLTPEGYGR